MIRRSAVVLMLIASLLSQAAFGDISDPLTRRDQFQVPGPSEFVYRNDMDETLIPVYLLGAVAKPGLYHIPVNTDLVSLMALAGGPVSEANLTDVKIKRQTREKADVQDIDVLKLVGDPRLKSPILANNDVVMIPVKKPFFSNDTLATIGVVAALATIIISGFLIKNLLSPPKVTP